MLTEEQKKKIEILVLEYDLKIKNGHTLQEFFNELEKICINFNKE